jgi:hypothetical protein
MKLFAVRQLRAITPRMKNAVVFTIYLSLGLLFAGCGGGEDAATAACKDFIDVIVARGGECGLPEGQLRSELNDTLECGRFTAVRNETELRGACFTAYRSQTCSQITSGAALPASCSMQFSRVASSSSALVDADAGQSLSSDVEVLPAAGAASDSIER